MKLEGILVVYFFGSYLVTVIYLRTDCINEDKKGFGDRKKSSFAS